jgi:hypothetical protein
MSTFATNMAKNTSVEKKNGMSYLSWAAAYGLANRPEFTIPTWDGMPYRTLLGGAVVAVDMGAQRMWLPILNGSNQPIPLEKITDRDVTDAHMRALVKAIAAVTGVGLSLYAGYDGDGQRVAALFDVKPGDDLGKVSAVVEEKGKGSGKLYVPWWAAIAACMMADPEGFSWTVVEFPGPMPEETVPYLKGKSGVMVAVDVTYRGRTHRQWLPVMDFRFNAKAEATVMEWNTAVMRALAKAVAIVSGYGLATYAGEDTTPESAAAPKAEDKPAAKAAESAKTKAASSAAPPDGIPAVQMKTVTAIIQRLESGVDPEEVKRYLASPTSSKLGESARKAIEAKLAELEPVSADAASTGVSDV